MATVLVVDDDSDVLSYLTDVLSDAGHEVIAASNGTQALDFLDGEPRVELLLTDIRMPDLNGFYLAHLAKARRPALKVLYLSGYHDRNDVGQRYGKLLRKPIRTAELQHEVEHALET